MYKTYLTNMNFLKVAFSICTLNYFTTASTVCYTDLLNTTRMNAFDNFVAEYNKSYASTQEYLYHASVFFDNQDYIEFQNGRNLPYTLGINQFADMTFTEFKNYYLGYRGETQEYVEYRNKHPVPLHTYTIVNTPVDSVDWRAQGLVTPIKDQAQCGSCWAFSAVATMEGAQARKSGNLTSLSEQDLVDCVVDCYGCGGGWPFRAIDWVINGSTPNNTYTNTSGNDTNISMIDTESSYPYLGTDGECLYSVGGRGANITGLVEIPQGNSALLQDAVLTIGPISVAIDAEVDFQLYKSGFFETTECSNTELDHAVTVVGFGRTADGRKYYIIKNSWGTTWGQDGYIYYSADIPNMCGIAEDACYAV